MNALPIPVTNPAYYHSFLDNTPTTVLLGLAATIAMAYYSYRPSPPSVHVIKGHEKISIIVSGKPDSLPEHLKAKLAFEMASWKGPHGYSFIPTGLSQYPVGELQLLARGASTCSFKQSSCPPHNPGDGVYRYWIDNSECKYTFSILALDTANPLIIDNCLSQIAAFFHLTPNYFPQSDQLIDDTAR